MSDAAAMRHVDTLHLHTALERHGKAKEYDWSDNSFLQTQYVWDEGYVQRLENRDSINCER